MPWPLILILSFSFLFFSFIIYSHRKAKQLEGAPIDKTIPLLTNANLQSELIVYAYSASCGPCKSISPMIDKLIDSGFNIIKHDVTDDMESTHKLNIRGTPTFVFIKSHHIEKVSLGACKESELKQFLTP